MRISLGLKNEEGKVEKKKLVGRNRSSVKLEGKTLVGSVGGTIDFCSFATRENNGQILAYIF